MNAQGKENGRCENPGLDQKIFDACAETAAGIGHELNNPLAIIAGQAQNLLKTETSEEKRRRLTAILEQTTRAYEMIVDLRTFARPPQPAPIEVDVEKFCDEWARREAKRCEENDVRLEVAFEFAENAATLTTDEAMLAAILNALTKNAVEATGIGGATRIFAREFSTFRDDDSESGNDFSSRKNGGRRENCGVEEKTNARSRRGERFLEIGVEDDGPGLSAEARELLFAPYFSGRQAGRGLGVGLAKARRLADALGLELRCAESKSFKTGLCWSVVLPF
ncbi:MAG: HAMP domain-containing histidine kinase [Thermoguttaceae bacterium]|nr:HAMP domain-containing histidine kinase [Thermoguttaceae bacterium]